MTRQLQLNADKELVPMFESSSAAVVFWDTFRTLPFSLLPRIPPGTVNHAFISKLPTELLVVIFKLVFMESRLPTECGVPETKWSSNEEIISPSLFPYAVASVSSQWRDIMATIPIFWTRFIVFIDTDRSLFPVVQHYLEVTHGLPLEVTIVDRLDVQMKDKHHETTGRCLLELLHPHIQRCESLCLCTAPSMLGFGSQELKFEYTIPSMNRQLSIDGPPSALDLLLNNSTNHRYTFTENTDWRRLILGVDQVTASHFKSTESGGGLHLGQLIEILRNQPKATALIMRDVVFDSTWNSPNRIEIATASITFIDMPHGALQTFFSQTSPPFYNDQVTIIHCSVTSLTSMWNTTFLTIKEMDESEDLSIPLKRWEGSELRVFDSPGFNDNVLAMMEHEEFSDDGAGSFGSPSLCVLHIVNCKNFSVDALKRMVQARSGGAMPPDSDPDGYDDRPVIYDLSICGCGGLFSSDDEQWFRSRVFSFVWQL